MSRPSRRQCLYTFLQRALVRSGLGRWIDFSVVRIVLSSQSGPVPSAWDADGVAFSVVGAERADWLTAGDPERLPVFVARFSRGWRCWAAVVDGRCAAYVWLQLGPGLIQSPFSPRRWQLPAGAAWFCDGWAHPLQLGTYPDLIRCATQQLRRQGVQYIFGYVEVDNHHSRRLHRMLGAREIAWAGLIRCLGHGVHLICRSNRVQLLRSRTPAALGPFLTCLGPEG